MLCPLLSRSVLLFSLFIALPTFSSAQGFGRSKDTVTLRRKLPALFHLKGTNVSIKVVAHAKNSQDFAAQLTPLLEAALQQNDKRIVIDDGNPQTRITCTVTSYTAPTRQVLARNNTVLTKQGAQSTQQQYQKVTGAATVAYNSKDAKTAKSLDAATIEARYNVDFEANGSRTKAIGETLNPKKLMGAFKKHEATEAVPGSAEEVNRDLIQQIVGKIASRIVNTDESLPILLARGKLEQASKFGESGLWSRMLEATESVRPFSKKEDEAYRFYNIGVAYEAMGYQAEDPKQAVKLLESAVVNYGKAIDAKPEEKYFREPQNRIEGALVILKTLSQRGASSASASKADATAGPESPSDVLTNEQILDLAKSGMNEENLIANIKEAHAVHFDLSIAGQKQLMQGGVSNNVIAAMRRKSAPPVHRARPPVKAAAAAHS